MQSIKPTSVPSRLGNMSCSSLPSYLLLILQHGPDPRCLAVSLHRKHALQSAPPPGWCLYLSTENLRQRRTSPPPSTPVSHANTGLLPHARPHRLPTAAVIRCDDACESTGSQHPRYNIRASARERVDRAGLNNIREFSCVGRAGGRGVGGWGQERVREKGTRYLEDERTCAREGIEEKFLLGDII